MLAKFGPNAQKARIDIKIAFRLLPIHEFDFELLGFKIQDMILSTSFYHLASCLLGQDWPLKFKLLHILQKRKLLY